jgi:hypothetical protein
MRATERQTRENHERTLPRDNLTALQRILSTFGQSWIREVTKHGVDDNDTLTQRFEQLRTATKRILLNSPRHRDYQLEDVVASTSRGSPHTSERNRAAGKLRTDMDMVRALCYDVAGAISMFRPLQGTNIANSWHKQTAKRITKILRLRLQDACELLELGAGALLRDRLGNDNNRAAGEDLTRRMQLTAAHTRKALVVSNQLLQMYTRLPHKGRTAELRCEEKEKQRNHQTNSGSNERREKKRGDEHGDEAFALDPGFEVVTCSDRDPITLSMK